jgi:hypothetical protein
MVDLRWDGDDFRNEQDSSGATADLVSHTGKLQQGYNHGSLTQGLAVYYSMKSGLGDLADETELDNSATVYGASWSSDSKVGDYSLDFNGSGDYAEASNFAGLARASEATISFWVKVDGSETYSFVSQYDVSKRKFFVDNGVGANEVRAGFYDVNDDVANQVQSTTQMQQDTWYFVTVVYQEGEIRLFLDGVKEDEAYTSGFGPLAGQAEPLRIGSWDDRRFLNGHIDDIRIFRRALSQPEIEALYSLTELSKISPGDTLQ